MGREDKDETPLEPVGRKKDQKAYLKIRDMVRTFSRKG